MIKVFGDGIYLARDVRLLVLGVSDGLKGDWMSLFLGDKCSRLLSFDRLRITPSIEGPFLGGDLLFFFLEGVSTEASSF